MAKFLKILDFDLCTEGCAGRHLCDIFLSLERYGFKSVPILFEYIYKVDEQYEYLLDSAASQCPFNNLKVIEVDE